MVHSPTAAVEFRAAHDTSLPITATVQSMKHVPALHSLITARSLNAQAVLRSPPAHTNPLQYHNMIFRKYWEFLFQLRWISPV